MHRLVTGALCFMLAAAMSVRAEAAEKVVIGYTAGADFLAAFVAKDQGFFAAHGIDAELQFIAVGSGIPAALQTGSLQIGTPTVPAILLAVDSGLGFKIVASNIETGDGFHLSAVVVRPDLAGSAAKDLEGTTIAVPGMYSFLHLLFVRWLADHGADPTKLHIVEVPIPNMGDTLRARRVDGVVPVDPFMSRMVADGAGRIFANYIDDFPAGVLPTIYTATRDYADAHRPVIEGFRAALAEGLAYHRAHPEAAPETLARYLHLPPEIAKRLPLPRFITEIAPRQIAFWNDIMVKQTLLAHPVDPATVLFQ